MGFSRHRFKSIALGFFLFFCNQVMVYAAGVNDPKIPLIDWYQLVRQPLESSLVRFVSFIPNIVLGVCGLIIGLVVARILQLIVTTVLGSIKFDDFAKRIGITGLISEEKDALKPHQWFGLAAYWLTIIVTIISILNQLNLRIVSRQIDSLIQFMFMIFSSFSIFVFGLLLSFLAARIVRTVASNTKLFNPDRLAAVTKWVILFFTVFACLIEIGLPANIIFMALGIVFVTLCITFVCSFGIGGIPWATKVLERTLKNK